MNHPLSSLKRISTRCQQQWIVIGWLIAGIIFLAGGGVVAAQEQAGLFEASACPFEIQGLSFISPEQLTGAECGYVTVPATHSDPDGATIRLPVAILRASGLNPQPDPLFVAQGGPGGSAFEVFALALSNSDITLSRDVVLFNQRGTPFSEPDLMCEEVFEANWEALGLPASEADPLTDLAYLDCKRRLEAEGIDLSTFDSLENAADIDYIRQALGYDQINFYGVSYGTLLGLHLMKHHPEQVRSVILDGVVPTQQNFLEGVTIAEDRAYDQYFEFCSSDADCRQEYPDLENRYFALLDKLDADPVTLTLQDEKTGRKYPALLDGEALRGVVFQLFYIPDFYAVFPKVVADLERERYDFLENIWSIFAFDRSISEGMYLSVVCAEDADIDMANLQADEVRPRVADGTMEELASFVDTCRDWDVETLPASIDEPVASKIPTLLFSGNFDPITPPPYGDIAAKTLSNSVHVINPAGAHGVAIGGDSCIESIMSDFLNAPTGTLDSTCAEQIGLESAVPDNVISVPFMRHLLTLGGGIAWKLGIVALLMCGLITPLIIYPIVWLWRLIAGGNAESQADGRQDGGRNRHRLGWLLALFAFIGLAILFIVGLGYFISGALATPLLWLAAVPASARPLFLIPLLLLILAVAMMAFYFRGWRVWSTWGKLYNGLILLCALGFVGVLIAGKLMFAVFS